MPYVAPEVVQREKQIDLLTYVIQKSQNCHHLKEQYVFTDRKKYGKVVVETNWNLQRRLAMVGIYDCFGYGGSFDVPFEERIQINKDGWI